MKAGIVGSPRYPKIRSVLSRVMDAGRANGFDFFTHSDLTGLWPVDLPELSAESDVDLLITLGGDGTLLRGLRLLPSDATPIMGVNFGHVGFLTTTVPEDLEAALADFVVGNYVVEARTTIEGECHAADGTVRPGDRALNDIVLHHKGRSMVLQMQVSLNDKEIGQYSADGIVLATPTGSTAYSLSSGGPIMTPNVDALVITPIAAHSLAVRPVVVSAEATITVELVGRFKGKAVVSYDGEPGSKLLRGEKLIVKRSAVPVKLIRLKGDGFFSRMRQKLQWGDLTDRNKP